MWTEQMYVVCLIVIGLLFFGMRERWASALKPYSVLIEFFALVLAVIFFIFPKYSAEVEFNKNLLATDCVNLEHAADVFSKSKNTNWLFNIRYSTSFYQNNWPEILQGLSDKQKQAYVLVVNNMDSSNMIVDRIETHVGFTSVDLVQANNSLAQVADDIVGEFSTLGVSSNTCVTSAF